MRPISFKRHRFPPKIIRHAIWLNARFILSEIGAADIQWIESYAADAKTFCVYLAKDESAIRKHAELSGFPATKITENKGVIDPASAK